MATPEQPDAGASMDASIESMTLPITLLNWIDRLPEAVRQAIRERMRMRSIQPGQHLWLSGQERTGIVQVISGRITIFSSNTDGRELRYFTFSEGDCLGEDSLAGMKRRHHSTTAETLATVATLLVADFWELAEKWPVIHYELYSLYARKSKFLFDYIDSIVLDPADVQIAGRICLILASRGDVQGQELELDISHTDLADMIGVTRQTVSSVLQRWRTAGLVDLRYRKLVVVKPELIKAIWDSRRALSSTTADDDQD